MGGLLVHSVAVRLGDGDLSERHGIQMRAIHTWAVHPRYIGFKRRLGSPYFDVAVVTLNREADLSTTYVRTICLPREASQVVDKYEGHQVDVAGVCYSTYFII